MGSAPAPGKKRQLFLDLCCLYLLLWIHVYYKTRLFCLPKRWKRQLRLSAQKDEKNCLHIQSHSKIGGSRQLHFCKSDENSNKLVVRGIILYDLFLAYCLKFLIKSFHTQYELMLLYLVQFIWVCCLSELFMNIMWPFFWFLKVKQLKDNFLILYLLFIFEVFQPSYSSNIDFLALYDFVCL